MVFRVYFRKLVSFQFQFDAKEFPLQSLIYRIYEVAKASLEPHDLLQAF